jgi:predicted N-acetyltransferase YhbS
MPDPVPVIELDRLAVDIRAHGMKLGAALRQDALQRADRRSKYECPSHVGSCPQ